MFITELQVVSFFSRVKINSTNWPAPNVLVFIAPLVEHCRANAEVMGSNPAEVPNFGGVNLQLVNYNYHCDDHIFIKMSFFSYYLRINAPVFSLGAAFNLVNTIINVCLHLFNDTQATDLSRSNAAVRGEGGGREESFS